MLSLRFLRSQRKGLTESLCRFVATSSKDYEGLYIHTDTPANKDYPYALSFSNASLSLEPGQNQHVIGWLKKNDDISPVNFEENPAFIHFMNSRICYDYMKDESLILAASNFGTGHMHIQDWRNPAPQGRIPEVEDIVGTVEVKDGLMIDNSFQPSRYHRLVSSNGLFKLSPYLQKSLVSYMM